MLAGTAGGPAGAGLLKTEVFSDSADRGEEKEKRIRDYELCTKHLFRQKGRQKKFFSSFSVDNVYNFVQNFGKTAIFHTIALWITFLRKILFVNNSLLHFQNLCTLLICKWNLKLYLTWIFRKSEAVLGAICEQILKFIGNA